MIARADAGDIARLEAMISHLAGVLHATGDTTHLDYRRAKALSMLANPALTCVFLAQTYPHAHAADTTYTTATPPGSRLAHRPRHWRSAGCSATWGTQRSTGCGRDWCSTCTWPPKPSTATPAAVWPGSEDPVASGPISVDQRKSWLRHDRITLTRCWTPPT